MPYCRFLWNEYPKLLYPKKLFRAAAGTTHTTTDTSLAWIFGQGTWKIADVWRVSRAISCDRLRVGRGTMRVEGVKAHLPVVIHHTAEILHFSASERRVNNLKGFKGFYLKVKARVWP